MLNNMALVPVFHPVLSLPVNPLSPPPPFPDIHSSSRTMDLIEAHDLQEHSLTPKQRQ